jgi:predicted DNA-binding protein YlxM (UPF0122 family)
MEINKALIDSLPHGSLVEIANLSGVSRPTVNNVIENIENYSGDMEIYNKVIDAIATIISKRAESIKKGHERLNKALQGCKI